MIDHIDTNIKNNMPSNLRWVKNAQENHDNDNSRRNKSIDIKVQQISLKDNSVIKVWDRPSCATRELGLSSCSILQTSRGVYKHGGGYKWKFVKQ